MVPACRAFRDTDFAVDAVVPGRDADAFAALAVAVFVPETRAAEPPAMGLFDAFFAADDLGAGFVAVAPAAGDRDCPVMPPRCVSR